MTLSVYVGYFSSCCDKISNKKQLILAYSLRGYSASLEEGMGVGAGSWLVTASKLRRQSVNRM